MPDKEGLYQKLPITLQNAACSVVGWRIEHTRFSREFRDLLAQAEGRSQWTHQQACDFRDERLRSMIHNCFETVPYYRGLSAKLGVTASDINSLQDLQKLPILKKSQVQDLISELSPNPIPAESTVWVHTSGTTGTGLRFLTTMQALREQWAIWWRYRRWHGIERSTWCGYFGGRSVVPTSQSRPPFWRYNSPGRQILFSGYHMNAENLAHYAGELRRSRPPWLHGYPSLLALLAAFVLDTGEDLGYQLKWITVGAESLLPQQADLIQRAFGVRPRQHYGLAEGVANISECDHGNLHVDEDFSAVEFMPDPDGFGCKLIGTSLTNPATPLIRYDTGDTVTPADFTCPCGRPGRIVLNVDGRVEDYIVLGNGARLGRMDHIFKDMVHIREAQIYQREPGRITLRIVPGAEYRPADEAALIQETRKRVGDQTDITIEHLSALERSRRGKLRFVVSDIAEAQLSALASGGQRTGR